MNSAKRVLWLAHDPGGKNATTPVVEALHRRGDVVGEDVERPDILLGGTSMGETRDKKFLREHPEIPSVYVMDFFGHYRARFGQELPTRLCVIDEESVREAVAEGFPGERLVVTGNPYFEHFADKVTRSEEDPRCILFVSQPVRTDAGTTYGFDEYDALQALIAALPLGYRLGIRLHPRDDARKYDTYLGGNISVFPGSLEEALSKAGCVVGMFSPVLIQAAMAGKAVVRFQPGSHLNERMGISRLSTPQELSKALRNYAAGKYHTRYRPLDMRPGATERIIAVIDALL